MRKLAPALLMLALLQGCASNAPHAERNEDLSSLQLFGADAQPRFDVDLVCGGASIQETRQCFTVSNAFYAWANSRHFRLRSVRKDDPSGADKPGAGSATRDKPYRLAIDFRPYFNASELAGTDGSYIPGEVGYEATIEVFDASGSIARKLSLQRRQTVAEQVNISDFIRADAAAVIAKIDPGYSP